MEYVETIEVDTTLRFPSDWANIYNVAILEGEDYEKWNEYKWAWNYINNLKTSPKYTIVNGEIDFGTFEDMQMRAETICRDIIANALPSEKKVLSADKKYIDTDWVRDKLHLL